MKLSKIDKYRKAVKLRIPSEGSTYETTLYATYKIFSASDMEAKQKAWADEFPGTTAEAHKARNFAFFDAVIIGVEGLEHEDGTQMDAKEGMNAAKNFPFLLGALIEDYNETLGGIRVKN